MYYTFLILSAMEKIDVKAEVEVFHLLADLVMQGDQISLVESTVRMRKIHGKWHKKRKSTVLIAFKDHERFSVPVVSEGHNVCSYCYRLWFRTWSISKTSCAPCSTLRGLIVSLVAIVSEIVRLSPTGYASTAGGEGAVREVVSGIASTAKVETDTVVPASFF
ncbi:hypothetical protein BJY04DRAFT_201585 [Aspergillus karnatakaensis]|uniref:uncharacterized protein n=1 Tax=Aspergillus karnatakaensis TaxID=1810916 RepID=UPI003CCDECF5